MPTFAHIALHAVLLFTTPHPSTFLQSNPEVQQFMQEKGFGNDFAKLEG